MNTISHLIKDNKLAVIESLVANDDDGMTRADIERSTGVGSTTIHRYMEDFEDNEVIVEVGRRGKAPLYRLNSERPHVVEMVRCLSDYALRMIEVEMENIHAIELATDELPHALHTAEAIDEVQIISIDQELGFPTEVFQTKKTSFTRYKGSSAFDAFEIGQGSLNMQSFSRGVRGAAAAG